MTQTQPDTSHLTKNLTPHEAKILSDFAPFLSFQQTWAFKEFISLPHKIIGLFTGNQAMKTSSISYQYVLRILGYHPIAWKNVLYFRCPKGHTYSIQTKPKDNICTRVWPSGNVCARPITINERGSRIFRFASEVLPGDKDTTGDDGSGQSKEIKNAQYPEFKKWLPKFLIKKDITFRNPSMSIADPNQGKVFDGLTYKGGDIVIEFVSYSQTVQSGAGVQRMSVWEDEEAPYQFHEEQIPRLIAEKGDVIISLTPANHITWTYDEIFERAERYIRTESIVAFLKSQGQHDTTQLEITDVVNKDIAVIQASTYDNPTFTKQMVDQMHESYDDPDVRAIRTYGIFKQVSGRIFKDFNFRIHYIDGRRWFPEGIFHEYRHARLIDYHEHNPWACSFVALSPQNEMFVYNEYSPSPEKMVTREIVNYLAGLSEDYKYEIDLIDPLANKTQTNTGTTVVQDMNNVFWELKREGHCTGGYFDVWDTKNTIGRDRLRERLKNSIKAETPFNNQVIDEKGKRYLPTIWIFNSCRETARSLKQWSLETWADKNHLFTKDRKEAAQQKHSHYCTALEAVLKDDRFRPRAQRHMFNQRVSKASRRMRGRG